jgi:hypothetical protein
MAPASGVSNAKLRELRQAQDIVEMQQSSFGAGDVAEHRTREGYKDKQKRKAFDRLETVCDRLRVAEGTLTRAKGFFAGFRDNREHVQKFDEAVAAGACVLGCACVCAAAAVSVTAASSLPAVCQHKTGQVQQARANSQAVVKRLQRRRCITSRNTLH